MSLNGGIVPGGVRIQVPIIGCLFVRVLNKQDANHFSQDWNIISLLMPIVKECLTTKDPLE